MGDVFQQGLTGPDVPPGERMFFDGLRPSVGCLRFVYRNIYQLQAVVPGGYFVQLFGKPELLSAGDAPARPKVYQAVAAAEAGQRDYLGEGFDFVRDVTDFSVVSCVFRCSPFALPFERGDDGGGFGTGRQREFPEGVVERLERPVDGAE